MLIRQICELSLPCGKGRRRLRLAEYCLHHIRLPCSGCGEYTQLRTIYNLEISQLSNQLNLNLDLTVLFLLQSVPYYIRLSQIFNTKINP